MSRRDKFSTKTPTRVIYTDFAIRCPICMKLHNKSKKFGTPYHLLYHINDHNNDDQTSTLITLDEIRFIVKQLCKAIQWRLLIV